MAALTKTIVGTAINTSLLSGAPNFRGGGDWPANLEALADGLLPYLAKQRIAALTAEAEAADVIGVQVQIKDALGNDIEEATGLLVEVNDTNMVPDATAFHAGAGAGVAGVTENSTTDRARLLLTTNNEGAAEVDVTDVAGASGATVHVVVWVISDGNVIGTPTSLTLAFD